MLVSHAARCTRAIVGLRAESAETEGESSRSFRGMLARVAVSRYESGCCVVGIPQGVFLFVVNRLFVFAQHVCSDSSEVEPVMSVDEIDLHERLKTSKVSSD